MKKSVLIGLSVLLLFLFVGCGSKIPGVTFNESQIIGLYIDYALIPGDPTEDGFCREYPFDFSTLSIIRGYRLNYWVEYDEETQTYGKGSLAYGLVSVSDEEHTKTLSVSIAKEHIALEDFHYIRCDPEITSRIASHDVVLYHLFDTRSNDEKTYAVFALDEYYLTFYFRQYSDKEVVNVIEQFILSNQEQPGL